MIQATISQLKDGLSAYLRQVKLGESVLVIDRKTPVARLVPLSSGHSLRDEQASYDTTNPLNDSDAPDQSPEPDTDPGNDQARVAEEEWLSRLESQGLIIRAKAPLSLDLVRSWTPIEGTGVLEALLQERKEDYESGYR